MMYTLKGRCAAIVTFLLFALSHGDQLRHAQQQQQQQQRYNPKISSLPWHLAPSWEYILREIILKSVTPSQLDANTFHGRPLDASFYGGPVAAYSNDDNGDANVVLSRGNVYHLLNGHWMLCQDGCMDCEPCAMQRNPLFKWVLRRVERLPVSHPSRHDLQLTITPRENDHFYASNLPPNSYIYVTSQGSLTEREREPFPVVAARLGDDKNSFDPLNLENSSFQPNQRSRDLWRSVEQKSIANRDEIPRQNNHPTVRPNAITEKTGKEVSSEKKHRRVKTRLTKSTTVTSTVRNSTDVIANDNSEKTNQLAPRLILGTDQRGQKHLIHVVPADHPPATALSARVLASTSSYLAASQTTTRSTNKTISKGEKQTYERILRRVFDSLNAHRPSIENFLQFADNVDGHETTPSVNNTEVVGSLWSHRDANADSEAGRINAAPSLTSYARNNSRSARYQQYRRQASRDYDGANRNVNNYLTGYQNVNPMRRLRGRESVGLNWDGERRKIFVRPYINNGRKRDIPRVNMSVLSQSSNDSSVNSIPKSGSNGFVINSAKQIDLNDTLVDKAFVSGNNSIESSSIMTDRENRQLFNSRRLESGDVNREFVVSRQPFGIIVTTEFSIIRGEHESLNRTKIL